MQSIGISSQSEPNVINNLTCGVPTASLHAFVDSKDQDLTAHKEKSDLVPILSDS